MNKKELQKIIRIVCLFLMVLTSLKAGIEIYGIRQHQIHAKFIKWRIEPLNPNTLETNYIGPRTLPSYKYILHFVLIWGLLWILLILITDIYKSFSDKVTYFIIALSISISIILIAFYIGYFWLILVSAAMIYLFIIAFRIYIWPLLVKVYRNKLSNLITVLILGFVIPWASLAIYMLVSICNLPCFVNYPKILSAQMIIIGIEHIFGVILVFVLLLPEIKKILTKEKKNHCVFE